MKKFFLFCMAFWTMGALSIFSKVYLVSVGIADYPGKKIDLRTSAEDAKTIAQIYLATQNADVAILTNAEATQGALLSTVHSVFANAGSDDTVMFYFSGHGDSGSLVCYDGLLSYQHLLQMFTGCKASKKIIIADACFIGKMRTEKISLIDSLSQNVMFFLSSRTNELSQETNFKNSMFTIFLERGLRGGSDMNKDRQITARELYDFVHTGVIESTKGTQHPVMWGKFDDNMTIINW